MNFVLKKEKKGIVLLKEQQSFYNTWMKGFKIIGKNKKESTTGKCLLLVLCNHIPIH